METSLPGKTIVLLGAGHTNAHILTQWRMTPIADARLVCVSNFRKATYSGMLPGVLAGLLPPEAMEIDLVRLCKAVGAQLIVDDVIGLNVEGRKLLFADRPPLRFDVLSIGIGSTPDKTIVDTASGDDDHALLIKPMQTFLRRLSNKAKRVEGNLSDGAELRVAVVGGGVAGVEISLCIQPWLARQFPSRRSTITLINADDRVAKGLTNTAQLAAERELKNRGVETLLGVRVEQTRSGTIDFDDGMSREFDLILLATSARPAPLLAALELPKDDRRFLLTEPTLECVDAEGIFAVGDSGTIRGESLPKAGVYAVRQGPVLWSNIRHKLAGRPLEAYRPQRQFLKLLCMGDGRAIASYRGRGFVNRLAWKWKRFIDERFMRMHQDYQPMEMAAPTAEPAAMRCVGCGGKVGGRVLDRVLRQLEIPTHPSVTAGLQTADDAAVLAPTSAPQAATIDFFAPPIDDMVLAGRIAALNAMNDVYAMGGAPTAALAAVTLPHGTDAAQEQLLLDILGGALHELKAAGASLAGGHTLEGPRVTIGFTVLGDLSGSAFHKENVQPGDAIVLTKPLGTGVVLAAHMTADCRATWMKSCLRCMLQSNWDAARIARDHGVTAATDVTGFGLAGHLLEMLKASNVAATVDLDAIPLLPGAEEMFAGGRESTMADANRELAATDACPQLMVDSSPRTRSLFDPQTSGGLLLAVANDRAERLVDEFRATGYVEAAVIARTDPEDSSQARLRWA